MKVPQNYCVKVLTTGIIVLILLSLSLFWTRWFCKSLLSDIMPKDFRDIRISPCGLVPSEIERDPPVLGNSGLHTYIIEPETPQMLGFVDYITGSLPAGRYSDFYFLKYDFEYYDFQWIYFNRSTGRIVCRYKTIERMPDTTTMLKMVQIYIGPEGISENQDENTGGFISPMVDVSDFDRGQLTLYDKKLRQYFAAKFRKEVKLIKGPQLSQDDPHQPVDIGVLDKNPAILDLYWFPPMINVFENKQDGALYSRKIHTPIRETDPDYRPDKYMLVLDESGQIDLLDKETLEFAGPAGHLPAPETLFPADKNITTDDLLSYRVLPMALKEDHKYRGLFATAVNREGTAVALAVFNEKGVLIKSEQTGVKDYRGLLSTPSSRAVLFGFPGAPTLTIGKFMLENLQPPILSLASFFTADSFEAGSGHRALFLLPNSFIAMKGRDARENIAVRLLYAFALMLPSLLLASWLAARVVRDANVVGLSRNVRVFWIIATVAFGLTGYITYQLTRTKVTLVTCANCGKPRRPDTDKCHRCGSKWNVPELIPPAWRVLDR